MMLAGGCEVALDFSIGQKRILSQNLLSLQLWAQISVEIIDCTLASSERLAPQADKFWPQVAHQPSQKRLEH